MPNMQKPLSADDRALLSSYGKMSAVHGHCVGRNLSPTYRSWRAMMQRVRKAAAGTMERYVGVTVCQRWHNFENFLADMGEKPVGSVRYSLDRYPNTQGNYEPGNCRWATYEEQANNQTSNTVIVFHGESLTMAQWAKRLGITNWKICQWLNRDQRSMQWIFDRCQREALCQPQK
jgi:hypothetical protein